MASTLHIAEKLSKYKHIDDWNYLWQCRGGCSIENALPQVSLIFENRK